MLIILPTFISAQEIGQQSGPQIVSPRISVNNSVTLRLHSTTAQSVTLQGSCMNFGETLQLTKNGQGVWSVSTAPLKASMYHYHMFVDGVSSIDPTNPKAYCGG